MSIHDFWPISSPPRQGQIYALDWLADQQDKYLIFEGPVGSGKSLIGMTYSRYKSNHLGDSYILTPQKILQHQYEQSFKPNDLVSLYGKSNYKCEPFNCSCDIGSMLAKGSCANCPYSQKRAAAIAAPNVVLNYKLALISFTKTDVFRKRQLIVCDECHTLEQHLVDFDCPTIKRELAISLKVNWIKSNNLEDAQMWLVDFFLPALSTRVELTRVEVDSILDRGSPSKREVQTVRDFNQLEELFNELSTISAQSTDVLSTERVLVISNTEISFKRIKGDYTFKRTLDQFTNQFLFMSSTILNPHRFCDDLSIDPDKMAFLSIDSEFDIANRPVFSIPLMKVNASWESPERRPERDQLLDGIHSILSMHENESGIIHTGNFKVAQWLVDNLKTNHQLINHNPESDIDRDSAIKQYLNQASSIPSILISPSCTEGLDLIGDLGRFSIFAKVPYGNLGDQWIKKRMEISNEWYQRQAVVSIIQGGGRVVRSPQDTGAVYIVDANWLNLLNSTQSIIPQWWLDSHQHL